MKKKVLHVLSSNDFAGAENVAMCIISNLSDSFECAYASPAGGIKDILASRDITYIPIEKFSYAQIRKVIKEWKPDIIHAHDFTATIKCLLASITVPVVSHIHQNPAWLKTVNMYSILFFLACLKIKEIIVVSPAIQETTFLTHLFNKKTKVIKNIIDINWITKKAASYTDKAYDIAFIGRFEDIKNPLRFINIVSQVTEEFPGLKVIMMGGGALEEECRKVIIAKRLQGNIDLKGFLVNPYPILKNSKVLVMTSKSEGLPMVAIEALSMGKPVIVPQLVGIENVVDRGCGYICKTDKEFVDNIVTLLNFDENYLKMSLAASIKAEIICDMDKYKEQVKQVYRNAI